MSDRISEASAYEAFARSQFDALVSTREPWPAILWHYTAGETFIKIIQSGSMWSTQVACLNDTREFSYAAELWREAMVQLSQRVTNEDEDYICSRIVKWLDHDGQDTSEFFVACWSEQGDDLSQWRAYGGGEGGFSIAFDTSELAKYCDQENCWIAPVCYDPGVQAKTCFAVAVATIKFFVEGKRVRPELSLDDWAALFLPAWRRQVVPLAPMMKHPAFAAEREWRIVRPLREEDRPNMQFLQRRNLLSRHLPLNLSAHTADKRLPLKAIMVGPCRYKRISIVSAGDLLRSRGYELQTLHLIESAAPFQIA